MQCGLKALGAPPPVDQLLFPLCVGHVVLPLPALIDSGAEDDLLDEVVAVQSGCHRPGWGNNHVVTHRTALLSLIISGQTLVAPALPLTYYLDLLLP